MGDARPFVVVEGNGTARGSKTAKFLGKGRAMKSIGRPRSKGRGKTRLATLRSVSRGKARCPPPDEHLRQTLMDR